MEVLEHIDENTGVLKSVTKKALKGAVKSREYIDVVMLDTHEGALLSLGKSNIVQMYGPTPTLIVMY